MDNRLRQFEWYTLLVCIIAIPLFEAPKTIFLILASIAFIARRIKEKDAKEAFLCWDPRLGFLALSAAAALSALFAEHTGIAMHGSTDYLKMYLLFIIIATDFHGEDSVRNIALAVIVSTTIGAVWGLIKYPLISSRPVELHSVGHFNHSSIYLAMAVIIAICLVNIASTAKRNMLILASGSILLVALGFTTSRGTYVALFAAFAGILLLDKENRKKILYIGASLSVLLGGLLVYKKSAALVLAGKGSDANRLFLRLKLGFDTNSLFLRSKLWETAWTIFKQNPLLGIGAKHYAFQDPKTYGVVEKLSHPHNLYLSVLSQNGILGMLALLLLFYLVVRTLVNARGKSFLWSAALGSFIIVLVNGVINTTLHSEHGLLFALCVALISAPGKERSGLEIDRK